MTKLLSSMGCRLPIGFAALAMVLGACGVPADKKPRAIQASAVPYSLLAPSTSVPPTTVPVQTVQVTVFLLSQEKLIQVSRTVAPPLSVGAALAPLIQGATDSETQSGLRSAVDPQTTVLGVQVTGDLAKINMSDGFSGISTQEQILALAQLVYTATAIPPVNRVQISINGTSAEVPKGDGTLTREPLNRSDFASLAPPARSSTGSVSQ